MNEKKKKGKIKKKKLRKVFRAKFEKERALIFTSLNFVHFFFDEAPEDSVKVVKVFRLWKLSVSKFLKVQHCSFDTFKP